MVVSNEPFVNKTTVGEVIVDKMNQANIYFYVIKFTILIGQSTIACVKILLPVRLNKIIVFYVSIFNKHSGLGQFLFY
jgi:hypothetical protein